MTLDQILSTVNYYAGKDTRGNTMSVSEFNTLIPEIQELYYDKQLNPQPTEALRPFIRHMGVDSGTVPLVVSSSGLATIPSDYVRRISVTFIYDGVERPVEVLEPEEFDERKSNGIELPTRKYPIASFGSDVLRVNPKNLQFLNFTYYRKPLVPYYDYCQDADTLNQIYMPVGSRIVTGQTTGQYDLNLDGEILASNVTKGGVTDDTDTSVPPTPGMIFYTSQTVELEWEDRFHPQFVHMLLAMVGINIGLDNITQYAEALKNAQK